MKYGYLLFCLLICFQAYPQPSTLCTGYESVVAESLTKFSKLVAGKLPAPDGVHRYASATTLGDATNCYIDSSYIGFAWYAQFGNFDKQEDAVARLKELRATIHACVPEIEFIEKINTKTFLPYYFMKRNVTGGFQLFPGELGAMKNYEQKYCAYFSIPENAKGINFGTLTNEPDNVNSFSREINRLMKEAETKFNSILGEKDDADFTSVTYDPSYCIPGALECHITEKAGRRTFYVKAGENLSEATADSVVTNLASNIAYSVGKKYTWYKTDDGLGTSFIETENILLYSNPAITVTRSKSFRNNLWEVWIRVGSK